MPKPLFSLLYAVALPCLLALALLGSRATPAQAATITVDGTTCTLADAITAANSDTPIGGCLAGSIGADVLDLTANITLTMALPDIASEITINGNNHTIARDTAAVSDFRILTVATVGNLTLNEVTLTGGVTPDDGGGVFVDSGGTAVLTNSTVISNTANSGGGISTYQGTFTLTNSTIISNSATGGGGGISLVTINSNSTSIAILNNSTVSHNTATAPDGAGGGIVNLSAVLINSTVTLINSTIISNTSPNGGGGIVNTLGTIILTNSTISGNTTAFDGGGITNYQGVLTLANSTVSGNNAGQNGGVSSLAGSDVAVGYSGRGTTALPLFR